MSRAWARTTVLGVWGETREGEAAVRQKAAPTVHRARACPVPETLSGCWWRSGETQWAPAHSQHTRIIQVRGIRLDERSEGLGRRCLFRSCGPGRPLSGEDVWADSWIEGWVSHTNPWTRRAQNQEIKLSRQQCPPWVSKRTRRSVWSKGRALELGCQESGHGPAFGLGWPWLHSMK